MSGEKQDQARFYRGQRLCGETKSPQQTHEWKLCFYNEEFWFCEGASSPGGLFVTSM